MAKKPKAKDDNGGGEGGSAGAGKSKMPMMIGAVVVLSALGGGGWWMMKGKGGEPATQDAAAKGGGPKKPVAFVDMKEMTINLALSAGQERPNFMKLKVSLEVSDGKLVTEIQPLLPRIEDTFQVYMRELRPTDLEGSAGVFRLKEELLRRVNVAVYPARVDAVLFKEILVQ
jgi:flagellar protein FliL